MKFLNLFLILLFSGCAWFGARTLSPEQLQGMKELAKMQNVSGCYLFALGGSFTTASGEIRSAICFGKDLHPTIDELIQLQNGISITVKGAK